MPPMQRLLILLKVLVVFGLIGPPVGALTLFATIGLYGAAQTGDPAAVLWVALFGLIYAVPLSYLIGIIPAVCAGLVLGVAAAFHRPPSYLAAMAAGAVVGLGLVHSGGSPIVPSSAETPSEYAPAAFLIVTCVVATVVCWAVARLALGSAARETQPAKLGS